MIRYPSFHKAVIKILILTVLLFHTDSVAAEISGYIIDEQSNPLPGTWITISGAVSVKSDGNGYYQQQLYDGVYTITASLPGYLPVTEADVSVTGSTSLNFSLPLSLSVSPNLALTSAPADFSVSGSSFIPSSQAWLEYDFANVAAVISTANVSVQVDEWFLDESAEDMTVVDSIAYVVNRHYGLYIFDVSEPDTPREIARIATPGMASGVEVVGETAYVLDEDVGLHVIDISTPSAPSFIGPGYPLSNNGLAFDVVDGFAYVAEEDVGLHIIDVSTSSTPVKESTIPQPQKARAVTVVDGKAYVVELADNYNPHFYIIDVSVPSAPEIHANPIYAQGEGVMVAGGMAYVAGRYNTLEIYNVIDPDAPALTGVAGEHNMSSNTVWVSDNKAYVGGWNELFVYEVSDPFSPELLGAMKPLGKVSKVEVQENIAYLAATGLQLIDLDRVSMPAVTSFTKTDYGKYITVVGDIAYVGAWWPDEFRLYNVSDPANPQFISSLWLMGGVTDIDVVGTKVFAATSGIKSIDVSTPTAPVELDYLNTSGGSDIHIVGNTAYVASYSNGLKIVNISDPENLQFIGTGIVTPGNAEAVHVQDNIAYVADQTHGLQLIDVGNPAAPTSISQVDDIIWYGLGMAEDVYVSGDTAYVLDGFILWVVDVSDPQQPTVLNQMYLLDYRRGGNWALTGRKMMVNGTTMYIAHYEGVAIVDINDAANPKFIGNLETIGDTEHVFVANNRAYIAGDMGFTILAPFDEYFSEVPFNVSTGITTQASIPGLQRNIVGNYNLNVLKDNDVRESLPGSITFTDNSDLFNAKAILVAGGGLNASGNIWSQTKKYANQAYEMLLYQGYTDDQIYYLTDQLDAPGRDGSADKATLNTAFSWAKTGPTSSLIMYLVDHGEEELFQIRGGANPVYVSAEEIDALLDDFQDVTAAKVLTVYDACKSGSFPFKMTPTSTDHTRVNITSAASDQSAYFFTEKGSFSSFFWSVFSGKSGDDAELYSAWHRASTAMAFFQTAQLDANGNGLTNEPDDYQVLKETGFPFGRQWFDNVQQRPEINTASTVLEAEGTNGLLSVTDPYDHDGDVIVRVWAEILGPALEPPSGDLTVTSGIEVDLVESLTNPGEYQGVYSGFDTKGTYVVTYFAMDSDGLVSLPVTENVVQESGTIVSVPDIYEPDNEYTKAQVINVNAPEAQYHNFHVSGDVDWLTFYAIGGEIYEIKVSRVSPANNPAIELYGPNNSSTLQASIDKFGNGWDEVLIWSCPADGEGVYTVRISNSSQHYGGSVNYELKVYNPIALSLPGYVTGIVKSDTGNPVPGVSLRSSGGAGISTSSGAYLISLSPGSKTINASKNGYVSNSCSTRVVSGDSVSCNITMQRINTPPAISGIPKTSVYTNELFSFTPTVTDDNWDSHSFSILGKPSWCSFNTSTGTLTGIPGQSDIGSYGPITITVSDSYGVTDTMTFSITVVQGANLPPIFRATPPDKIKESMYFNFNPSVFDPNGDPVTLTISGKPDWIKFNSNNGNLSGFPGTANIGEHGPVTIRATDSHGAQSSLVFILNVLSDEEYDKLGALPAVFNILLLGEE